MGHHTEYDRMVESVILSGKAKTKEQAEKFIRRTLPDYMAEFAKRIRIPEEEYQVLLDDFKKSLEDKKKSFEMRKETEKIVNNSAYNNTLRMHSSNENNFEGISKSDIFLAIVTENFVEDTQCFLQARWAVEQKKKVVIMQKKGVEIPEEFFKDAEVEKHFIWDSGMDYEIQLKEVLEYLTEKYQARIKPG